MKKRTKKDLRTLKSMGIGIAITLIFISELLFYTWCRVQCVRVGYEISQEVEKHRRLIALQNNLKIELARLKSPERIARIARSQLGLVMPNPEYMIAIP